MNEVPYLTAGWVFLVGLYGMASSKNLVHQVMCLSVVQSATYVLLLASGYRNGGIAPILIGVQPQAVFVDPVVQALALTDIVVGAAVTALLLAIIIRVWRLKHMLDPDALTRDES